MMKLEKHSEVLIQSTTYVTQLSATFTVTLIPTITYLFLEGRKHDAAMLADSQLLHNLLQFAYNPAGQAVCVYGDPAYPLRVQMQGQGPFRNGILTLQMEQYNREMSALRISVEWLFGDIINSFKFNDFKKDLKLFLSSVGKIYVVSFLLRNAITCLYGNITSNFFDLRPPTLDSYFG